MSRPDYATTKSGLIGQVRKYHDALEALTADRDRWKATAELLADRISIRDRGDRHASQDILTSAYEEAGR